MIPLRGYEHDYTKNFFKETKEPKVARLQQRGRSKDAKTIQTKPKGPRDRRKAIPPVSPRRKEENKRYEKEKRIWRKERKSLDGLRCQFETNGTRCGMRADNSPHHIKRRGKYLCAREWFMAVCREHHRWIEDNGAEAEKLGYLIREYKKHENPNS